ncbi:hypothetical protein SAMN02745664_10196 [Moraxella cuniculi DSM 21768]|uniref:Uncharacterized protein n=1 Tax=Moraxella cuniculi DSM 21768 TaxID=1122245 RepID=A0A1N7D9B4_9GAMM|nr:hypothetical protein [Moraxella cuniculi]SIR72408.1 hypothetical protein SAMN02745664_10196 [Moraxella cuniculi DSM 21768]
MQNPLIIYQFTDPMMGLSYESEPFFRQVESHFGEQIRFQPIRATWCEMWRIL